MLSRTLTLLFAALLSLSMPAAFAGEGGLSNYKPGFYGEN